MKTNLQKFEQLVQEFAEDVSGRCLETSAFIGEVDGKLIRLSVMTKKEAIDQHDFEEINALYNCIEY